MHAGGQSAAAADSLEAQAFTRGRNIYFGAGYHRPATGSGKWLMAHELSHVIQQGGAQPLAGSSPPPTAPQVQTGAQPGTIQRAPRAACATHMAQIGNSPVCRKPPNPGAVGSQVGAQVERMFRAESPGDRVTQLPVPAAPKTTVHGESGPLIPASLPSIGKIDVVKVVARGPKTVRIQIGEVKPMKWTGLAAGLAEVEYYTAKIEEAEDVCVRYQKDFVEGLERRLKGLPPREAERKRKQALSEATRLLGSHLFCQKLNAVGKRVTLAKPPGLTWRSRTFNMTIGGRSRKMLAATCDDGVIGYRCLEKPEKKKKKKEKKKKGKEKQRRTKRAKRAPRTSRAARAAEKRASAAAKAARKATERELRKKGVQKVARKAIAKTVAKVAGRVALRAIPVIGWVLLAIDIAEAAYGIYQLVKYGPGEGGGGGGGKGGEKGGGEGTPEGEAAEGAAGGEGGREAERGEGEGKREGEGAGKAGGPGGEGAGGAEGAGKGKGEAGGPGAAGEGAAGREGAEEGKPEGKAGEVDEDLARLGIFDSPEQAEAYAESLPLSKQLIDSLKASSPEQQRLLELMLDSSSEPGRPRVTEDFFLKVLEMTSGLTPAELEKLEARLVPVSGETLDDVLKKLQKAIKTIREGAGEPAEEDRPEGGAKKQATEGKKGKGVKGGGTGGGEGGGKGAGKGKGKAGGEGKAAGKAETGGDKGAKKSKTKGTGVLQAQEPPAGSERKAKGLFRYQILSGLSPTGSYQTDQPYTCRLRIDDNGRVFEVAGVKMTYVGRRTEIRTVKGKRFKYTIFKVYITEDFWVDKHKFFGRSGLDDAGNPQPSDYEFTPRPVK